MPWWTGTQQPTRPVGGRVLPKRRAPGDVGPRLLVLVLVVGLALGLPISTTAQEPTPSTQVARRKALLIEQFTRLVEWPESALPDGQGFSVCIVGRSQTADELIGLARWREFKGRSNTVRVGATGESLRACQLLYIAQSEAQRLESVIESIGEAPVLVVGDTPSFVERGVHLNLFEERRSKPKPGTYVGFELNVDAVRLSRLFFDPQLLSQGRRVHSARPKNSRSGGL